MERTNVGCYAPHEPSSRLGPSGPCRDGEAPDAMPSRKSLVTISDCDRSCRPKDFSGIVSENKIERANSERGILDYKKNIKAQDYEL